MDCPSCGTTLLIYEVWYVGFENGEYVYEVAAKCPCCHKVFTYDAIAKEKTLVAISEPEDVTYNDENIDIG